MNGLAQRAQCLYTHVQRLKLMNGLNSVLNFTCIVNSTETKVFMPKIQNQQTLSCSVFGVQNPLFHLKPLEMIKFEKKKKNKEKLISETELLIMYAPQFAHHSFEHFKADDQTVAIDLVHLSQVPFKKFQCSDWCHDPLYSSSGCCIVTGG